MAKPRMIQGQFGSIAYNSGVMEPGVTNAAPNGDVVFRTTGYLGVQRHNDEFYIPFPAARPGDPLTANQIHFATFDYIDLRDLLEEKSGLDEVTINVQRLRELPFPDLAYNVTPGNIEETLLFVLGDLNLETSPDGDLQEWHQAGFAPIVSTPSQGGLPFEVLYRETRQYVQDPAQNFVSPGQVGTFAGPGGNAAITPSRVVGNFRMVSRTIGGYPDLIVGPGITVIRVFSVYPADRTFQSSDGGGPTDNPAAELTNLRSFVSCTFPALQYNIVGTQRKLTATETATYYSNIMLNRP